ncbi:MAG TPA: hypothetical protein QGF04_00215 [Woeseiaceae bacterium]|jgi:hypothetical protein|nr:hypothetical protein [Woeseiaceae bacterium]|tara:strand:- start:2889 stop:3074 length:186 start_codon:yes stop_codon:yes gene_type:complete
MKIKQPTIIEGWDAYRKLVDEQLKIDHLDRLRKLHEKKKKISTRSKEYRKSKYDEYGNVIP